MNVSATPAYDWNFGDGSPHNTNQYPAHSYAFAGSYHWSVSASVQSGTTIATTNLTGTIVISAPMTLAAVPAGDSILLTWPQSLADALVEESPSLGPLEHWTVATNAVASGSDGFSIATLAAGNRFFRLRKL